MNYPLRNLPGQFEAGAADSSDPPDVFLHFPIQLWAAASSLLVYNLTSPFIRKAKVLTARITNSASVTTAIFSKAVRCFKHDLAVNALPPQAAQEPFSNAPLGMTGFNIIAQGSYIVGEPGRRDG